MNNNCGTYSTENLNSETLKFGTRAQRNQKSPTAFRKARLGIFDISNRCIVVAVAGAGVG